MTSLKIFAITNTVCKTCRDILSYHWLPDWDSHKHSRIDGIHIVAYETVAHLLLGHLNAHPHSRNSLNRVTDILAFLTAATSDGSG